MRWISILILLLGSLNVFSAEVYRSRDADGNVIFSDTPAAGAEKIKLKETTIVAPQKPTRRLERLSPETAEFPGQKGYETVAIASPAHEETLRNADGVTVSVTVSPELNTAQGHTVQLYYDGAAYGGPTSSTSVPLAEVERGQHSLAVAILDADGNELARSDTSVFFMHRQSQFSPNPSGPARPIAR